MTAPETTEFGKSCRNSVIVCSFLMVAAIVIAIVLPSDDKAASTRKSPLANTTALISTSGNDSKLAVSDENEVVADFGKLVEDASLVSGKSSGDLALSLYRQPSSRGAVEWFFLHVTGSRETALPILAEADKNDIPLSLAFALAYTESRYKTNAVNKNRNASIDRGLFQLNNKSFPQLTEEDFFNPAISAKYGMSHLRFCMNVAGNEVSGLAMYNAGTTKVRQNNTPQSTLNYVGKIMAYRDRLDKLFAEEVLPYYDASRQLSGISVAVR